MSKISKYPEYQENDYKKSYAGTESQIITQLNNYTNPILLSTEMKYDQSEMIVAPAEYAKPKYIKEKNTYEVLKPLTKQVVELPIKRKQKVKTVETVYKKEIVISENEDINKILENNNLFSTEEETPMITQSVIQNLCKDSVIDSNYPSFKQSNISQAKPDNHIIDQNIYESKFNPKLFENQQQFQDQSYSSKVKYSNNQDSKNSKGNNNYHLSKVKVTKFPSTVNNINNDYKISKVTKFPNTKSTINESHKINASKNPPQMVNKNINSNFQSQRQSKNSNIIKESQHSKLQNTKISYINEQNDGGFFEKNKVSKNSENNNINSNKNYIETYFHDDDIPKPIVFEGDGLKDSSIKEKKKEDLEDSGGKHIVGPSFKNTNNYNSSINKAKNIKDINNKISPKLIEQNKSFNNSKNNNLKEKETNSLLAELPVDQTEIMSHQPSINISQMKNSNMFQKSVHQSTIIDQGFINDSNIQQSKVYQQQSKPSSKIQQSNVNQKSFKQSNISEKSINPQSYISNNQNKNSFENDAIKEQQKTNQNNIQKSNMTYQYNQSKKMENHQTFHSQNAQHNLYNESKYISEINKNSIINQEQSFGKNSKINNQSNIYQKSMEQNNMNNLSQISNKKNIIQSEIGKNNQYNKNNTPSIHQSKEKPPIDLISSNNKSKLSRSEEEIFASDDNIMKNNNQMNNFKGENSSFPAKSNACIISSKEKLPPNPFGEFNNSIKNSNTSTQNNF